MTTRIEEFQTTRGKHPQAWKMLIYGTPGCLSGETFIPYKVVSNDGRSQNRKGGTLRRLYERFNKIDVEGRGFYQREISADSDFFVSSMDDEAFIRSHKIEAVIFSGVKKCLKVKTRAGLEIIATPDHEFYTGDKYVALSQLNIGDAVAAHFNTRKQKNPPEPRGKPRRKDLCVKYHPSKTRLKKIYENGNEYSYYRVRESRAICEAKLNNLDVNDYLYALNHWQRDKLDQLKWLPRNIDVHHLNENVLDNRIENLMLISHEDHARHHVNSKNIKFSVCLDTITSIEDAGDIETYDIRCQFPYHNFVANGFVVHNCGKSTLATSAPDPFFLDMEGGLNRVDCWKTEKRIESHSVFLDALRWATANKDIKTIVIDTLDELDSLLSQKVCDEGGKKTLNDFPYGKGGDLLVAEWRQVITIFEKIRQVGKNVLLIGHEQVIKFEDPTSENYDRFQLKIHKKSAPLVTAKMDAVLFARYETIVKEKEDGRGRRAVGGDRILHCLESPSWVAKNRFGLPEKIPMDADLFKIIV